MQKETIYLEGMVEYVTFQNPDNGFCVLHLACDDGTEMNVVGTLAACAPGERLVLTGRYINHKEYGRQFEAFSCEYIMPSTIEDIEKYLASGTVPGIGPVTASRIVKEFGEESLEILAQRPERLATVKGLSLQKAKEAHRHFLEVFHVREAVVSLAKVGLSAAEAIAVYRHFGKLTMDVITKNPYQLCGTPLYLPFAKADAIAQTMQNTPDNALRTRAAIIYTLRHNLQNGHTCVPKKKLTATVSQFFSVEEEAVDLEMEKVCQTEDIHTANYDGIEYIYLAQPFRAEFMAALRIRSIVGMPAPPPGKIKAQIKNHERVKGMRFAPLQVEAINQAMSNGAMVITGGPGTGKTTTVNAIIALFEAQAERVLLAAPTGKAAKRMSELCGRNATTIHRMLGVEFREGDEVPRFKYNEKNLLRCDVLIVDEMSMVDAFLFESLLVALRSGCRLVMVGDIDQLPSVGPGNVLRGIIDSGVVPVVELKEVFRQAEESLIVKNAHRIVNGKTPQKGTKEDDYFFLRAAGSACRHVVCELASERLSRSYGFDPFTDIQVLCPTRKGPLGTEELNTRLQQLLNPPNEQKLEIRVMDKIFRVGDKVMQTKNDYDVPYIRLDGEVGSGAFNGEIGIIEKINKAAGSMTVLCDDRRIEYSQEHMGKLEIAYAVTIHKSQGSEFEAVIIPLSEVPKQLQYRNLLYTGVTRAKKLCVLVGEERVMEQMVKAGRKNRRYSCFSDFLKDEELL